MYEGGGGGGAANIQYSPCNDVHCTSQSGDNPYKVAEESGLI